MTDAEIEQLLAAATPGPWDHSGECEVTFGFNDQGWDGVTIHSGRSDADAALIAVSPTLIAGLLERAKQAEAAKVVAENDADQLAHEIVDNSNHSKSLVYPGRCGYCYEHWPCSVSDALAAHERAVTQRNEPA